MPVAIDDTRRTEAFSEGQASAAVLYRRGDFVPQLRYVDELSTYFPFSFGGSLRVSVQAGYRAHSSFRFPQSQGGEAVYPLWGERNGQIIGLSALERCAAERALFPKELATHFELAFFEEESEGFLDPNCIAGLPCGDFPWQSSGICFQVPKALVQRILDFLSQ